MGKAETMRRVPGSLVVMLLLWDECVYFCMSSLNIYLGLRRLSSWPAGVMFLALLQNIVAEGSSWAELFTSQELENREVKGGHCQNTVFKGHPSRLAIRLGLAQF